MKPGSLDRRIKIQRRVNTQSSSGAMVASWSPVSERAASVRVGDGDGKSFGPGLEASQVVEFIVRYSSDIASLSPNDQIIFPAASVSNRDIYNVLSVFPVGRNNVLKIIANRKEDAS